MAPNVHGYTKYKGYTWRLCPYSTAYRDLFYLAGFRGPSTNPALQGPAWSALTTTIHTQTEGRMSFSSVGGEFGNSGWVCTDPACQFFITNGTRYTEN